MWYLIFLCLVGLLLVLLVISKMGSFLCCSFDDVIFKKGLWILEEDEKLFEYINMYGYGNWKIFLKYVGLNSCGKSCSLSWVNYLSFDIKSGSFFEEEESFIINFYFIFGNKYMYLYFMLFILMMNFCNCLCLSFNGFDLILYSWLKIVIYFFGWMDNEIKNFWNIYISKKFLNMGFDLNIYKLSIDFNYFLNFI